MRPSPAWRPTIPARVMAAWSASVMKSRISSNQRWLERWRPSCVEAWMSANRIAVSWRAGWSSSAMRANMPWLPRVISETMLAGAAGQVEDHPARLVGQREREAAGLGGRRVGLEVGELGPPQRLRIARLERPELARLLVGQHRADRVHAAGRVVRHQRDVRPQPVQRRLGRDHAVQLRDPDLDRVAAEAELLQRAVAGEEAELARQVDEPPLAVVDLRRATGRLELLGDSGQTRVGDHRSFVPRRTRPAPAPASLAGPCGEAMPSTRIAFRPRPSRSRPSVEPTSRPERSRTRSSR